MHTVSACIYIVNRDLEDITDDELEQVLEQMRKRQQRLTDGGEDPSTAAAKAGLEVSEVLKAAANIEKRNALINRRIRLESLDYLSTTWSDDLAEGVLAMLYGSAKAREGSRASANAAQSALTRKYLGGVIGELEHAG